MGRLCNVEGCKSKHHAHGFCQKHLHRFIRYGDPNKYCFENDGRMKVAGYTNWEAMVNRCKYKHANNPWYKDKDIVVYDRWLGKDGFKHFILDMGIKPGKGYTTDRLKSDKGYCKDNCEWVTHAVNCQRRKSSKAVPFCSQKDIAEMYGVHRSTIYRAVQKQGLP